MNNCIFIGFLTNDPIQVGEGDNVISTFSLAVDRNYVNRENDNEKDYPNFVAKGRLSHLAQISLKKGAMVGIMSHYQTRKETDESGTKRYDEFVVNKFIFIKKPGNFDGA